VRRRRRQVAVSFSALFLLIIVLLVFNGGSTPAPPHHPTTTPPSTNTPLAAGWRGDGQAVTLAFGGDVHFESQIKTALDANPATALNAASGLFAGSDLAMVNLETALTSNGSCPTGDAASKQYLFFAGPSALTALRGAGVAIVSMANDHALDCGDTGLTQTLALSSSNNFPIVGIGNKASQAFAPYKVDIRGQRISIIAATQVIDSGLETAWTASATQPGVASAIDDTQLLAAVRTARRQADTVVVYLHWGTEADDCPNTQQEPLANALVAAGADVVVGTNAHVLEAGGYLGNAVVDYGLGNLAFYDISPPETTSGALVVSITGRHVDALTWRPATLVNEVATVDTSAAAPTALASWNELRGCSNLGAHAGQALTRAHGSPNHSLTTTTR
jgi:poly-gamma-glutamate synthesis protein (capsule biosynthesis protein)